MRNNIWLLIVIMLAGCSEGAVVFAPTPPPPDLSPLRYDHPSGAFSVTLPRNWSVFSQNTVSLASASFAAPGQIEPSLSLAAVNLGQTVDAAALGDILNEYQTRIRPDADRYVEEDRQAMGDGSWRLTGLRHAVGGRTEQVNTFITRAGTFVGVVEVIIPDDTDQMRTLQTIVNTFTLHPDAPLQAAGLTALSSATRDTLEIVHVSTWSTPSGVFFITGEVANYGDALLTDIPVRAVLLTDNGLGVAEAVDTVMGYGLPPGGFAPFSLRFGQGEPARTENYELSLGNEAWKPDTQATIIGPDELEWTDESAFTEAGQLVIDGTVTNTSQQAVRDLRAVVTVFDDAQTVIAAGFSDVTPARLSPGETTAFQITVPEMGGTPAHYIVNVQGKP